LRRRIAQRRSCYFGAEARDAYRRALALTGDDAERRLLVRKLAQIEG
jgi:predicted RNA polymerase sigma factor